MSINETIEADGWQASEQNKNNKTLLPLFHSCIIRLKKLFTNKNKLFHTLAPNSISRFENSKRQEQIQLIYASF